MLPRTLARRDDAALGVGEVLVIFLLIAVPIGLFVALFVYLRRTAPGGTVPPPKGSAPEATTPVEGPATRVAGSKNCPRCGVPVKPFRGRLGSMCPNCGSGLAT